uniref:Serine/threonine-protein kinase ULK3 n=1 Tax=Cacopsylla melanoneura TaxID=428564 RepID=A0A8D8YNW0_9HEMI
MSQDKDNTSKLIKLKGFKIQHKIGSGSFSTVYKAWTENKDHVEVAIKCIDKTKVSGKRFDNIVNEIKVLKLLHHEHIVSMIDFLWDERYVYIVLEYCDGGDLSSLIKSSETKLSEFQVQRFVRQLVLALKYLREHNVCHLDLKPQNILIKNNRLKLGDFGFARFLLPSDNSASLQGSPLYMAPEILAGAEYNASADLWSLGVLTYEALFGAAPYAGCTMSQLRAQALNPQPVNIPSNTITPHCHHFLSHLLQKDPAQRLTHDLLFSHPFPDLAHTPSRESYETAVCVVSCAVEQDSKGQHREALSSYCEALNYFVPLAYEEPDTSKRKELEEKIVEYKKRVEELRHSLISEQNVQEQHVTSSHVERSTSSHRVRLSQYAESRPNLKAGLEIGDSGDMYLVEGNYEAALDKLKSSLSILIPMCESEPGASAMKPLLAYQIQDWLSKAEHSQAIVDAARVKTEEGTAVNSKCTIQ